MTTVKLQQKPYDRWKDQSMISRIKSGEIKTRKLECWNDKLTVLTYQEKCRVFIPAYHKPDYEFLCSRASYFVSFEEEFHLSNKDQLRANASACWHRKAMVYLAKILNLV